MESNIKKKISLTIFIYFVVTCFGKEIIKIEEFASTEVTSISTTTDANFKGENVTEEYTTSEFYNEKTTIIPLYNNETVPNKVANTKQVSPDFDFCACDLQLNICDLNCCCDQDCSSQDKEVFEQCEVEPRYYDARYCDYVKYIYINNTRFEWEINQNGLFCVVKSNTPPSFILQRKHPLKTFEESEYEKNNKFSWPQYTQGGDSFNSSSKFIYGSPIWYVDQKGLHKFDVPNSFITNRCLIKENIFYLKNIHTSCSQVDLSQENSQLSLKYYIDNVRFVAVPKLFNITKYKDKLLESCPKNVCLSITPKICDESFTHCANLSKNDSRINIRCNLSIKDKSTTCVSVVKKLKYIFYHNGTKGLTDILLLTYLDEISYEFGTDVPQINQDFFVNFFWSNITTKRLVSLSGNPGYLIGRPIAIGILENLKNGTDTLLSIKRNVSEYTDSFLTIPKNLNGYCIFTSSEYLSIEFGYNVLTRCQFQKTVYNHKKVVNGTELCRTLQKSILKIWNIHSNKMVGSFGNADIKKPDDWQKILYKKLPQTILNTTLGEYYPKNNSVLCKSMIKSLNMDIFHSRVDVGSLINQEKILALTLSFDDSASYSLSFKKDDNSLLLNTELELRVSFYDLTVKKERKVVDPPSLDIKLPYDFFYPFVRINNSGNQFAYNFLNLIILFIVLYLK